MTNREHFGNSITNLSNLIVDLCYDDLEELWWNPFEGKFGTRKQTLEEVKKFLSQDYTKLKFQKVKKMYKK